MLRFGLTGGIGSGKSTVASLLAARGVTVIDADGESRKLTGPGGAALPAIAQAFGAAMVDADSGLRRAQMRELAFSDPSALVRLEGILHPIIGERMAALTESARQHGAHCVVYDIPLLLESTRWRAQLDRVLVVDCEPETQVQRVCARSGLDEAAVHRIMAAQVKRLDRLQGADDVLFNGAQVSREALAHEVAQWAQRFGL